MVLLSSRIHLHNQRLRVILPCHGEPHRVHPRQDHRNSTASAETSASASARWSRRRGGSQIPNPSMHTRGGRQRLERSHPVRRDVERLWIHRRSFVFTRILAHDLTRRIENLECYWTTRVRLQVVVDDRASGSVLSQRFITRHRRAV